MTSDEQQKQDGDGLYVGLPRVHCDHFSDKHLQLGMRCLSDGSGEATAPARDNAPKVLKLSNYRNGEHWKSITQKLDQLKSSDFLGSTLSHVEYEGITIPQLNGEPSLLFYGLTADVRYNGAATAFQERLQDQRNWLPLQAVSGAGKTRAIFDVFANSDLEKNPPLF